MTGAAPKKRIRGTQPKAAPLRERAEALLRATPRALSRLAPEDLIAALHELQVHQMELELQNEELRQTQALLAQAKDRYTDLYEFSPVGYLRIARDGEILEGNLTASRMLNQERRALTGRPFAAFVAPAFQDALFKYWQQVFASEDRLSLELELRAPAGHAEPRFIELQCVRGLPVSTAGSLECRAALVDISDRKRAQSALQRWNAELEKKVTERTAAFQASEQSLADFFSRAPIGLLQVDPLGRIQRVNRAQLDILGLGREEVEGKTVFDVYLDAHEVEELLESLAHGQEIHNHRGRLRGGGGRLRHVLVDANGLWKGDTLLHTRWFVRDISSRLELESAILAIAEQERERVGHDLHDDLCQQLTAIECLHDSLLQSWRPAKPEAAQLGKAITVRLHETLEHTRNLARGLSPSIHLGPDGLASALEDLAALARGIFLRDCRFVGGKLGNIDDPLVRTHLFRIAQEAVSNAIKHSQASRIEIKLEESKTNLILSIRDNGVGLPEPMPPSKGMGLRIAHYRATMINGAMTFQSRPGEGTAVICTIKKGPPG